MSKVRTRRGGLLNRGLLWIFIIIVVVTAVGIGGGAFGNFFRGEDFLLNEPVYEVQPGPLMISVNEAGTIRPQEQLIIKNELEGRTTILYLIPEGTEVKKGELLVELDASSLVDGRIDQQIQVQNGEANYIGARENFEVVKNQAQSDIDVAELAYEFAQQDLQKYNDGEFPMQHKELSTRITLADEELSRAKDKYKWSEVLFKEKYISETELKSDELAAKKAELDLELSRANLDLLQDFTKKRMLAQLVSDVTQAAMALERTNRKAAAEVVQASAEFQAKLSEYERQVSKLKKIEDQIGKAKIYAPMDGMVIYSTSVRTSFRGNEEPLDEGQEVRERQELIYLPTTAAYMVEMKVHESNLEKIKPGLPVRITVEALGQVFTGVVNKIAPLPDAQSIFMNPDLKVYRTEILITSNKTDDLRNGMTCRAEIIVHEYKDATFVPVHAVVRSNGKPTVYVAKGGEWETRVVELGLDNNRMAQITSGLKPGEKVWLAPPLTSSEATLADTFEETGGAEKPGGESTSPAGERRRSKGRWPAGNRAGRFAGGRTSRWARIGRI
ncbi:MAG: HlyD family efflux transporter periplasmic adaptor subunit [bacterium]